MMNSKEKSQAKPPMIFAAKTQNFPLMPLKASAAER
jgi:hypothetical protein